MSNPLEDFGTALTPGTVVQAQTVGSDEGIPASEPTPRMKRKSGGDPDMNLAPSRWMLRAEGAYSPCGSVTRKLPGGMYTLKQFEDGSWGVGQLPINIDELLDFPDSLNESILNEIKEFWTKVKEFKYYGFLHRRGYMFYGPHGSGKSCLVQQIIKHIIQDCGLVAVCDRPNNLNVLLRMLRVIEPDRHIVCLFEDIDAIKAKYGESELLSILDGENQIDSVLNIATTNYPELLDRRLVARPRRFDRVIKIDWPSAAVRRHYFKHKLKIDDAEINTWVNATDKFSFAACAELVISVKCLGKPFDESVDTLKKLSSANPNSKDYDLGQGPVGFGKK